MWICTSFGILMPSVRPAGTIPQDDDRVMQIRARRRQDLEILKAEYMGDTLGEIQALVGTDYEYRAYCTRADWATAMAQMSLDIDYTKFKPTTDRYKDHRLHTLYLRMWGAIMHELSTKSYQEAYWRGEFTGPTVQRRKGSTRRWWQEEHQPDVRDVEDDLLKIDTSDVDDLTTGPDLRPNGTFDHSMCSHGGGNAARKRCRRRWTRQAA
jgi:hypothetical protein